MRIALVMSSVLFSSTGAAIAASAQQAPTIELDPVAVELDASTTVKGSGFQPGSVGIHVDAVVVGAELASATIDRTGTFVVNVPLRGVTQGTHQLLACRDVSRTGECRELAVATFRVSAPTPTTTTPTTTTPATTTPATTTPATTTTTTAATTTTTPATTTASAAAVTTRPPETTQPPRTTTTAPTLSAGEVTVPPGPDPLSPATSTIPGSTTTIALPAADDVATATSTTSTTSTTPGALAVATTTTSPGADALAAPTLPGGPDPTFDPTPNDLVGLTTTTPPQYAADLIDNEYDVELTHIEVTQGLQNLANEFPLVEDRPTAVRVFGLTHGDVATLASAFLEVSRDGQVIDILEAENNPVQFPELLVRSSNDAAPYFLLDPAHLHGTLTLRAMAIIGDPSLSNDTNPADNLIAVTVTFHPSDPVTVHAFPLYLAEDGTSWGDDLLLHTAEDGWLHQAISLYRIWPLGRLTFDPFNPPVGDADSGWDMSEPSGGSDPFPELAAVHALNGYGDHEFSMGMVHNDADAAWGGFAQVPGAASWSRMSNGYSNDWPWNQKSGGIIAQELGHNTGLAHAPCAEALGDPLPQELHGGAIDPTFPQSYSWPDCSLAPTDPEGFYGFDVQYAATGTDQPSIMSNHSGAESPLSAAPFMSYMGIGKWLDPWHGCALLQYIGVPCTQTDLIPIDDDTPGQGQGVPQVGHGVPVWTCASWDGPDDAGDICNFAVDEPFDPIEMEDIDHELFVTVAVDPDGGAAELAPGMHLAAAGSLGAAGQKDGRWTLRDYIGADYLLLLRDADGEVIGVQTLDVNSANGQGHGEASADGGNPLLAGDHDHGVAQLLVRLPALASLASMSLVSEQGVLAELAPGASPPLIEAFDVELVGGRAELRWTSSEPDGDATAVMVQYATNAEWIVVAEPSGDSAQVDMAMLPGGAGRFRLVVSDGIHQAEALSEPVTLPDRAPFAAVVSPAGGTRRPAGRLVELRGTAIDIEDGSDVSVTWRSDLDGELGAGGVLGVRSLGEGTHTITMTVTDSAGAVATSEVIVHITASDLAPGDIVARVADRFRAGPPVTGGPDGSSPWLIAGVVGVSLIPLGAVAATRRRRTAISPAG